MTIVPEPAEVDRFRALVRARFGLDFDEARSEHLAEVLGQRVGASARGNVGAYLDRLAVGPCAEWRALAEHLTVGETYFFRYQDHFRAFVESVLPGIARSAQPYGGPRVLSAGSASGEEAYSIAILIRENLLVAERSARIVGIDVNPRMVERAARGRYSPWSLRATPADVRGRYFRVENAGFRLDEAIRSMVSFEERNLVDDDPAFWKPASFDVVFCRNVLMYMTQEARCAVLERVSRVLAPGGFLFLGHAETLRGISHEFHLRHTHDTFYYQLRSGASSDRADHADYVGATPRPSFATSTPTASPTPPHEQAPAADVSWFDAIARASDRVATLTDFTEDPERAAATRAGADMAPEGPERASDTRAVVLDMMRQERFVDALAVLRDQPASAQADPERQLLRAVLLTNGGQVREAEELCERLLTIDELSAGAHYLSALCREHAGDRASAADHDQTATYLDPTFAMPRLHLGLLERRAGHLAKARAELQQALALLPAEDASRIALFGGGFGREALIELCRAELRICEAER